MARDKMAKFDGAACGYCGARSRTMYPQSRGGGKNSRTQHGRMRVCERGHRLYVKRGQ